MTVGDLVAALVGQRVEFVVVGSAGLRARGMEAAPEDLDVVPEPGANNLRRLLMALEGLSLVSEPLTGTWRRDAFGDMTFVAFDAPREVVADPTRPATLDRPFTGPAGSVDVMLGDLDRYGHLRPRSQMMELGGSMVPIADIDDLLALMTTARRAKDAARLRSVRDLQRREKQTERRRTEAAVMLARLGAGPRRDQVLAALDLLETGRDPFERGSYRPGHITASAFVVHPTAEAMVLVHHVKLGMWVQPGGHVEPTDPTLEAAARREVAEETGLEGLEPLGPIDLDVHVFPARSDTPEHLHFDLRWAYRASMAALTVGDGSAAVEWVPLAEVRRMDASLARPAEALSRTNVTAE
jgi:8-oxo-dGTP pyrophosphatase MutT (NUDIX family)